jgi:hypothetical protein
MQLPSIDQNICGAWTQQQLDLYNKLPFYLLEAQAAYRQHWTVWSKLLDFIPWKPNMGDTMRRVAAEPTPIMRQEAFPERLSSVPKTDVINYRERKIDAHVHWQDFVSPHFNFLPEFQDFMKHIDRNMENINKQVTVYEDVFYRTRLFHHAPYVYVCGVGLVAAPTGDGDAAGTTGKTWGWLQNECFVPLAGVTLGYLTFEELFKALNEAEQTVGMTPFEGTGKPGSDSNPLNERFCLVQSPESWNNFVNDPWLKENRPLAMNIVTEGFKGDLWGRIRSKLERYPLRYQTDSNHAVTALPVPEVIEENDTREDFGRTKPNPIFTLPVNSPYEVAFLVGGKSAEYIEVGPPPAEFIRSLDQGAAVKMNWNGKSYLTKDFLVPCKNQAGTLYMDANSWGRYIRAQASLAVGISPMNMHNVLPIIYKRRIGIKTISE